MGQNDVFFYWRKVIFKGLVDHVSEDYDPASTETPSKSGVCVYYRYSKVHFVKTLRAFFSALNFPKIGLLKRRELGQFLCYKHDSHIKT